MFSAAALQFASTDDVECNLATCLRMIDAAAVVHHAELMVLPEFCNHLAWYSDRDQALRVAVTLDGPFLLAVAARAAKHRATIVINCSLRRGDDHLTVTSLIYGPDGQLVAQADKQTLMGHENLWFARAEATGFVFAHPKAVIGAYPCRDGVTMETPRCLALRGVQVMCNSLNSFALDEAALHVPVRAAENHVFVVAANKVGLLIPAHLVDSVSSATLIPVPFLEGAGESQIVAPDGRVLARAPRTGEAIVSVAIDPSQADAKVRPDGTHIFGARRPDLYRPIGMRPRPPADPYAYPTLDAASISIVDTRSNRHGLASYVEPLRALAEEGVELVVLPELFCFESGRVEDPDACAALFPRAVRALAEACAGTRAHVVTSLVEKVDGDFWHMGVIVGQAGIVGRQPQLHVPRRHGWASAGRRMEVFRLPWGKLGLVVGDDMIFPEVAKLAALGGAHVLAAPCDLREPWEVGLGLPSRSAENRVCIVMATRPSDVGQSALFDLEREFTLMQSWSERVFDGRINDPLVTRALADQAVLRGTLHPVAANNKVMSAGTHLLDQRPFWLVSDLLRAEVAPAATATHVAQWVGPGDQPSSLLRAGAAACDTEAAGVLSDAVSSPGVELQEAGEGESEVDA